MKKITCCALIIMFCVASTGVFAETVSSMRAACKRNKAAAHKVNVQVGLAYKTNAQELESKFKSLDTNRFCDCAFDGFEKSFGAARMSTMMQFSGQGEVDSPAEVAEKDRIYFACFGDQIGQSDLLPPSQEEITQAYKSYKSKEKARK